MKKTVLFIQSTALSLLALVMLSCNSTDSTTYNSVLVVCQGTAVSNGSITQYNTKTKVSELNFYEKVNNGLSLGLMPMSLTIYDRNCWVPVDGNVMTFNPINGAFKSRIPGMSKPSYIGFFGNAAYISDTFKPELYAYNMNTMKFFDTISLTSAPNVLLFMDSYLYTNLWSYGKSIVKINPMEGKVVETLEVGIQPNTIKVDQEKNLWTITDGGYQGNPLGDVAPEIVKVSTNNGLKVVRRFALVDGPNYQLNISTWGNKLYYTAGSRVFCMSVDATALPTTPIIEVEGANFSTVAEDPFTGEIYVADAGNWVDNGKVYRYGADYKLIDSFATSPNPIAFCFVQ